MLNKITIGKYYYRNSMIHKWNPISKLICSLCFIISLFILENWMIGFVFGIVLILLILLSDMRLKSYIRVIWSMRYMFLSFFLFNWIFGMPFTQNSLLLFKLICVLLYSTMVLYTTSLSDFTYAITFVLYPLSKLRIPIPLISQVIGLSISFLPNIVQKLNRILKSLAVRGIDYTNCSIKQKIYIWKVILNPLFSNSLQHADAVADTMEVRLYNLKSSNFSFCRFSVGYFDLFQLMFHIVLCILVWKEGFVCGI